MTSNSFYYKTSTLQSSWTKQAVQVASSQAASPCNQAPEHGDSTCAQVIRSNAENSAHEEAHMNPSRDYKEEPGNDSDLSFCPPSILLCLLTDT